MNLSEAQMGLGLIQARDATPTKRCRDCGETKSVEVFGRQKENRDSLKPYCNQCASKKSLTWQKANYGRHVQQKHTRYYERYAKRFSVWKLDGTMDGLYKPYLRALYRDPCSYCGDPGGEADHIFAAHDRAVGQNITPPSEWMDITGVCRSCNIAKHRQSLLEFLGWPIGWLT